MIATLLTISQPALLYCKFNLHYLAYSSAVLMSTPYIIYQFLNTNKNRYGCMLLLFGFLQGGLSFDFIIHGTGIALLFLFFPENNKIDFNKYVLYSFMILVLGSLITFIAHFIQNSLYFGSVKLAFEDLFGALLHRSVENIHFYNLLIEYLSHTYT